MSTRTFGQPPYRAASYTSWADASADAAEDGERVGILRSLLHDVMGGDFGRTHELAALVDAPDRDVRQYCHELLADVCTHEQVEAFRTILRVDDLEPDEACRVLIRLGDTLSPRAVPVIFTVVRELDDPEVAGYAADALHNILPWEPSADVDLFEPDVSAPYLEAVAGLDSATYYYRGAPVHAGDVAVELMARVATSAQGGTPVTLVRQAHILSSFSGVRCPVEHGAVVGETQTRLVQDYVDSVIHGRDWERGAKYFFGHKVG